MSTVRAQFLPCILQKPPAPLPPAVLKADIVRRFRQAAERFRIAPDAIEAARKDKGDTIPPAVLEQYRRFIECGKMLVEAHAAGLVPRDQKELIGLIDQQKLVEGMTGYHSLFHAVNGGGHLEGVFRIGTDGRVHLDGAKEVGGLMSWWDRYHLDQPHNERHARTCEVLAHLIETAPDPGPPPRMKFDDATGTIYLDGEVVATNQDRDVIAYFRQLCTAAPDPVVFKVMKKNDPELTNHSRTKKKMPDALKRLFISTQNDGNKLVLPPPPAR